MWPIHERKTFVSKTQEKTRLALTNQHAMVEHTKEEKSTGKSLATAKPSVFFTHDLARSRNYWYVLI